jgi:hypothetical protein
MQTTETQIPAAAHTTAPPIWSEAQTFERNAKIVWISVCTARELIRAGEFERAHVLLNEMGVCAEWLLKGPPVERILGRSLLKTVSELSLKYVARRMLVAADLVAALPAADAREGLRP